MLLEGTHVLKQRREERLCKAQQYMEMNMNRVSINNLLTVVKHLGVCNQILYVFQFIPNATVNSKDMTHPTALQLSWLACSLKPTKTLLKLLKVIKM